MAFTKAMSMEGAPHNVLVNALHVGVIVSDQMARRHAREGANVTLEEFIARHGKAMPIGRMGKAEEFANMACFLGSDAGWLRHRLRDQRRRRRAPGGVSRAAYRFILQAYHPEYACPAFATTFTVERIEELQALLGPDAQDDPQARQEALPFSMPADIAAIRQRFDVTFEEGEREVVLFIGPISRRGTFLTRATPATSCR